MSEVWGANPDELDALAARFADSAVRIDELRTASRAELVRSPWAGRDAEQFRNRWESEGTRLLSSASAILRAAGETVRTNAADQRRTSSADGGAFTGPAGGPGAPGGPGGPGGPMSPAAALEPGADYAAQIAATRSGMEDDLERRRHHLAELEDQLAHADGGPEEWFKDVVPYWDSDAEAIQGQIDAERQAISRLERLLDGDRQFLKVDAGGDGRIIEVHGNLEGAERIAIFVPGVDTTIDSFLGTDEPFHPYAHNLHDEMERRNPPGTDVAVVSFLDYDPPNLDGTVFLAAGESRATEGAENLASFVRGLHDQGYGNDSITVVGHSYGSTATGIALEHEALGVSRVAVVGSPGLGAGVDDISDLHRSDVHVYAGRAEGVPLPGGSGDPVSWLPAHGEDPADSGFGATRFATGTVSGHSGYFTPQSESLRNLALIALGQEPSLR